MSSVLVFDSGVGGLSVLTDILRRRPDLDYYYACDNAAFPYGVLPADTLISRVEALLVPLVARHAPALVVIACNTASTVVLPRLREVLTVPVVGVVPAIKPAAKLTTSGRIGLLATPATVERRYISELISQHATACDVSRLGSTRLVTLAEQLMITGEVSEAELAAELQPWLQDTQMDTLVLGCTHFPLLKEHLASIMPGIRHWVDSGDAIARRVDSLLSATNSDSQADNSTDSNDRAGQGRRVYCTLADERFSQLWPVLNSRYGFMHWQLAETESGSGFLNG